MQANKFKVPRLGFINKLDRLGAHIETTTNSIKRRLKVEPIMVNIPSSDSHLNGLIDLSSTFLRVYQGVLKNRMKLKNATLNENERVQSLLRVKADET